MQLGMQLEMLPWDASGDAAMECSSTIRNLLTLLILRDFCSYFFLIILSVQVSLHVLRVCSIFEEVLMFSCRK